MSNRSWFYAANGQQQGPYPEAQLRDFFERALAELQSSLVAFTGSAGVKLIEFVVGLVILIVATFFFFADGPYMVQGTIRLIPLDESYVRELFEEFYKRSITFKAAGA